MKGLATDSEDLNFGFLPGHALKGKQQLINDDSDITMMYNTEQKSHLLLFGLSSVESALRKFMIQIQMLKLRRQKLEKKALVNHQHKIQPLTSPIVIERLNLRAFWINWRKSTLEELLLLSN